MGITSIETIHESKLRRGEVVWPLFGRFANQPVVTCGKGKFGKRIAVRNGIYFQLDGCVERPIPRK